jgi:hypothetical protein
METGRRVSRRVEIGSATKAGKERRKSERRRMGWICA